MATKALKTEGTPGKGASQSKGRKALVDATIEAIYRHGLCGTSVGTITKLAGLSRAMVSYHFESKNEMLVAAYETLYEEWSGYFDQKRSDDPRENVILQAVSQFAFPIFDPKKFSAWVAFSIAAQRDEALRRTNQKAYAGWRASLIRSLEHYQRDTGNQVDVEDIATTVLCMSDGLWLQLMLDPENMTPERASRLCASVLEARFFEAESRAMK
ncbi:MAG: TetR family transcriptional regulator C-terminal domain-containing protein [Roseovarius sp.]